MHGLSFKFINQLNSSSEDENYSDTDTDSFHSASDFLNLDAANEFLGQNRKEDEKVCISSSSGLGDLVSSVMNGLHDVVESMEDDIKVAKESSSENEAKLSLEERRKLTLQAENLKEPHPEENSFCGNGLETWLVNSEKLLNNVKKKTIFTTSNIWDWSGMKDIVSAMGESITNLVDSSLQIQSPGNIAQQNVVQQGHLIKGKQNSKYQENLINKKDNDKEK